MIKLSHLAAGLSAVLLLSVTSVEAKTPAGDAVLTAAGQSSAAAPRGTPTNNFPLDISGQSSPAVGCADPSAPTLSINIGANAVVTGFSWDILLETVGESWASEATLVFGTTSSPSLINFRPGVGVNSPTPAGGTTFTGGPIDLSENTLPNIQVDADGLFLVRFCEGFADNVGGLDANYLTPSSVTVFCFDCQAPAPAIEFSPTSLDFGAIAPGSTSDPQTLTVSNTGTAAGSIVSPVVNAPFALVGGTCPTGSFSLAAGDSCTYIFTFSPTAEGVADASFTFGVGGSPVVVSAVGLGTPVAPPAAPRPAVVPVDNPWALLTLMLGLGVVGGLMLRRQS